MNNSDEQLSHRQLKRTAVPSAFYCNINQEPEDELPMSQAQDNDSPHNPACNVQSIKMEKVDEQHINETRVEIELVSLINCRTCLKETDAVISLTNDDDGCTLGAMLEKMADVRMEPGLPDVVCVTCAEDLRKAITFSRRARLADNALRQKTQWRVFGDSTDTFSNLKIKQESFASTSPDQTSEIEEEVYGYKYLEPSTAHAGDNKGEAMTQDYDVDISSQEGRLNELQENTCSNNKTFPQTKPILNETLKSEPMFVDVTKKEIKLKPVQLQDVLKALGPDKLPPHIKKIQQNKVNKKIKKETLPSHLKKILQNNHNKKSKKVNQDSNKSEEIIQVEEKILYSQNSSNSNKCEDDFDTTEDSKIFHCQECNLTFDKHRSFRYHMEKHRGYTCRECGRTLCSNHSLKIHIQRLHTAPKEWFPCNSCDKKFKMKEDVVKHYKKIHEYDPNTKAYCATCDVVFKDAFCYKNHLRTHSAHVTDNDYKFKCTECERKFLTNTHLKAHIDWDHLNKARYSCDTCGKRFRGKTRLAKHIMHVHQNIPMPKDRICDHCGRGFTSPRQLRIHVRTHTGERPLQCELCTATFAHPSALYNHRKLVHKLVANKGRGRRY